MDPFDVRLVFDPTATATALSFIFGGILLGTISGLIPGLHANNFALLLASVAVTMPGPPEYIAATMIAAGVVHSFLDIVPALALGVPEADTLAATLPGHRLVLAGRGHEALRLSAIGSALAVLAAIPLAVPVTMGMIAAYPLLREHISLVLGAIVVFLLLSERTGRKRVGAALGFLASGALGWVALDVTPDAPLDAGGMLAPLLAGLFGAPVLLAAFKGVGVPPQDPPSVVTPLRRLAGTAFAGSLAGAIVAYLPGISSAIAAVLALVALPGDAGASGVAVDDDGGARGFLVASSGVDTANAVFALFALVALGTPRTGVTVAMQDAGVPLNVPLLLVAVAIAGPVAAVLVVLIGDRYLTTIGRRDPAIVSVSVIGLLILLSYLFAGPVGLAAFAVATMIGLIPPAFGAQRVHLMGVLLGPLIVGQL